MAIAVETACSASYNFAIVDEVDSILIDEARTPLIISGAGRDATDIPQFDPHRPALQEGRATTRSTRSTHRARSPRTGITKLEKQLGIDNLYDDAQHRPGPPPAAGAARPRRSIKRDKDYVVKDGEVVIVDEFTGRLMPGRR